jgi:hypothetical protein
VFESSILKRIFGTKREEVVGEDYIMRNFITCTVQQITL